MDLRYSFSFLIALLFFSAVKSQTPTWNADIAPIIFEHCSTCHHEGGIAPMSLTNYAEAYDEFHDIGDAVEAGEMPPWPADENYVHFKDERILNMEEKDLIAEWVLEGAPQGVGTEPVAPAFNDGPLLTDYDLSIDLPEYTVSQDEDEYRTFVIHSGLATTKYINASEFIPDNGSIIHHMLIYQDTSDYSWTADQADPGPGFASNGTTTSSPYATLIGAWAPGDNIYQLPPGMGIEVPAGADFAIEIHFAPENIAEVAAPQLHLKWSTAAFTRPVWVNPILYHFAPVFQEPLFYIPANTVQTFHEIFTDDFDYDLSFISAAPHMHYLGQTYLAYAKTPANDSIPLIYIDNWDFHWQYGYTYQKLLKIPAHTDLYGIATYDNTSANEDNPNDPPQDVWLGEQTTDEMMLCFFAYTFYLPGDENIILDSTILETNIIDNENDLYFSLYPNPVNNELTIVNQNPEGLDFEIIISDISGRNIIVENMNFLTIKKISMENLPTGIYSVTINSGGKNFSQKIVKTDQ
ncbi:MAG: T9SS type A sorting domain-containing protein [Chitinophagales bacterium]